MMTYAPIYIKRNKSIDHVLVGGMKPYLSHFCPFPCQI